jgi:tetratricopeptide (TPR) repeat protein
MKIKSFITIAVVVAIVGLFATKRFFGRDAETQPVTARRNANTGTMYSDALLEKAQLYIERLPKDIDGYNLLASAWLQKARETGDFQFNARAASAIESAEKIEPTNIDTLILKGRLLLAEHRFSEVVEVAKRAQSVRPEHPDTFGLLADALVELGNYDAAVQAAQKLMDLRPDLGAYSRAAYIRALHGETDNAMDAMAIAIKAAHPREQESTAWCQIQLANILLSANKPAEGEKIVDRALEVFPDYHLALAAKGKFRVAAGDFEKAIEFYTLAQERVPLPDVAVALGDIYTRIGKIDEARRQYELVEFIEGSSTNGTQADSRLMAMFWADRDINLDKALEIAQRERTTRSDIYTMDMLAWCLFKKGNTAEAKTAIQEALRLGTHDARIYYHAGMIFGAAGDKAKAGQYLKLALKTRTSFDNSNGTFEAITSEKAKAALAAL